MISQSATVSDKYQTVIPRIIRKVLGLDKGDKVIWRISKNQAGQVTAIVTPKQKNWAEYTLGLGKDLWKGEDAQEYINKLRDEWEDRKI